MSSKNDKYIIRIIRAYKSGLSMAEIGRRIGRSEKWVRLLLPHNVRRRSGRPRRPNPSPDAIRMRLYRERKKINVT